MIRGLAREGEERRQVSGEMAWLQGQNMTWKLMTLVTGCSCGPDSELTAAVRVELSTALGWESKVTSRVLPWM